MIRTPPADRLSAHTSPHTLPRRPRRAPGRTLAYAGLALASVAWTGGCASEDAAPSMPVATVRDSAGVTLVENPAPPADLMVGWTVAPAPAVDIGTLEGEEAYQLYRVRDAQLLDAGTILVANGGGGDLRLFDAQGGYLATWGGQGEGPGEFQSPDQLSSWPGSDSIAVWDRRARRMTLFTQGGDLGRMFSFPGTETMQMPTFVAALSDGSLLVSGLEFRMDGGTSATRIPTSYATLEKDGSVRATLGTWDGAEMTMSVSADAVTIMQIPFARTTVASSLGDRVIIADNATFALPVYQADGTLERIIRVDLPPAPITDAVWGAEVERRVADAPEGAQAGLRANFEKLTGRPETLPTFDRIVADPLGNIWVRRYRVPVDEDQPHRWLVFDADGQAKGWVETPAALDVYRVGTDYLLGRAQDELDVEHVQRWGLTR